MTSSHCSGRHLGHFGEDADAGVVDEKIETAEARHRPRHHTLDVRRRADIRLQRLDGARAGRLNLRAGRRQMAPVSSGDRDVNALGDERARDGQPDAARSARHDRHFSCQRLHSDRSQPAAVAPS